METEVSGLFVAVAPSEHEKCERCWHRRADVGQTDMDHPSLCARCVENVAGKGEVREFV